MVREHDGTLRELEIGMKAEANKLQHLGLDYLVRRSTLAEANISIDAVLHTLEDLIAHKEAIMDVRLADDRTIWGNGPASGRFPRRPR